MISKKNKTVKFRKGQKLVCVHYKDKPIVKVVEHRIFVDRPNFSEVWVSERTKSGRDSIWWGPKGWFKPLKGDK